MATKTNPQLVFGFDASSGMYAVLDDVSVVDNMNSGTELLVNPSFETSSTNPTGWFPWCATSCSSGVGGTVISSPSVCRTGNCYKSQCAGGDHDFLVQPFAALINRTYTISFWHRRIRFSPSGSSATFYVNVI